MSHFQPGDEVTVTDPVQPTRYVGGETAVVVAGPNEQGVIKIQDDADGALIDVYPQEITKR